MFLASVDSTNASDATKLSYLISLVKGEASNVLAGIIVRPENYSLAKGLLRDRYGQSKKVTHLLFQNILNLPQCSQAIQTIQNFYDALQARV